MLTIFNILEDVFKTAFVQAQIPDNIPVLLTDASRPEFGDFQINGIMAAAKLLKKNPRELAFEVVKLVKLDNIASKVEIAGPGFINITLNSTYLENFIDALNPNNHFGAEIKNPETIIVDLSSPNLAKEMHVGHLRSTIIGDALARIFEYQGHKVIRQNHVGDWGTQFGMLIAYLTEYEEIVNLANKLSDLEACYRMAKKKFDEDPEFADRSRKMVAVLQSNTGENAAMIRKYWAEFTNVSLRHCQEIYDRLRVNLSSDDVCGESFYNDDLPGIVNHLTEKNMLTKSDGALCVFFTENEFQDSENVPFIVQKTDGGFLYATTDLAAINYRVNKLHADRIVYVVDARQSFHFKQLFLVGKKSALAKMETKLEHIAFGTMMDEGGRPFKTRSGEVVKLADLINEAIARAKLVVKERNSEWTIAEQNYLANIMAIASIKYADLSKNRTSDYIFSFDKMLAFDGNTAPYLLYAYTRIQSVLSKFDSSIIEEVNKFKFKFNTLVEHKLALQIAKFGDTIFITAKDCYPHYLCQYLYDLSVLFMQFYEACPILKAGNDEIKSSRLRLSQTIAIILRQGLELLGIPIIERM